MKGRVVLLMIVHSNTSVSIGKAIGGARNLRRSGLKLGQDPARRAAATRQRIKTAIAPA